MAFTWEKFEAGQRATARMEELLLEANSLEDKLRAARCSEQRASLLALYRRADAAYWKQHE